MNDDGNLQQKSWHCPNYNQFHVREWEEESFLFNPASGDTHLLNALSIEILRQLKQNRLSAAELVEKLPEAFGSIEPPLTREHLIQYLQQFEAIGLIVSSRPCD